MAFFLLGRGPEDELHLLAPTLMASRQDALAELTRLTAEPSFDSWDSEVFVVDFETAIPVLLVRPTASEIAPVVEAEAAPAAELVDVAEFEAASDAVGGEDALQEDAVAVESPVEILATPVAEQPVAEPVSEPVGDEAIADEITAEAASEVAEEPPAVALRDALLRTTEHMEASGITAPDSIGPAAEPEVAQPEPAAFVPEPEIVAEPEVALTEPTAVAPEIAETFAAAASSEIETPDAAVADAAVEAEVPATPDATQGEAPAWPWDLSLPEQEVPAPVEPAPVAEAPFVLDALEEPAIDDSSILRGAVDDEDLVSARPVILGTYGDSSDALPPIAEVSEPMSAPDSTATGDLAALADILPNESLGDGPAAEAVATSSAGDDISDFILDLGSVTNVPEAADTPAASPVAVAPEPAVVIASEAPSASPLEDYTCDDCVYVETCPNKDQRLPKDCGSFQWK